MKEFRKENGLFICEECGKLFGRACELSVHIKKTHKIESKLYYDKWLKEDSEGICCYCGNKTEYAGHWHKKLGYYKYCCKECMYSKISKTKHEKQEKYKLEHPLIIIEKAYKCKECGKSFDYKKTLSFHINKYHNAKIYYDKWCKKLNDDVCINCGNKTDFVSFSIGYKTKCCKKCENEYRFMQIKNVFTQKYGFNMFASEYFFEKSRQTCKEKYDVDNPTQNKDILEKAQKSSQKLKQFNTNLWYQGSYELDFLEKYYDKHPDIQRAPSIRYNFSGKQKIYHPDFYIPSLNLIIEIKNSYLYNRDKKQIKAKEKATIANNYNYAMILDKNYKLLNI